MTFLDKPLRAVDSHWQPFFRWSESFSHLSYQVVPQGASLRVFDTDGGLFPQSFTSRDAAINFVEEIYIKSFIDFYLEQSLEIGLITDDQFHGIMALMYSESKGLASS